ncbi:hypothetical protein DAPPUDRAFT_110892 [Daphnia pulex]|uniref:Endonuclease/exonuclease/phosphatase domain-containing protein n=1 Tax=Daphnia pulex TaxID=6669 RepID=E9H7H2_DAPPU|nr:hypothetical protein DAPPUDRAFT_110892 [Daphnia pulex]|eukprot:EFX72189.1 hypothetical protein DAPPUDRAFT_110892 [Daphnia pulex]
MPASKPSYASATRGQPCPVLIANYADGAKPAGPRLFSQCRPVAGSRLGRASPTAVALFVNLSYLPNLKEELMYRNDELKDKVHSCRQIFTKPGTNTGHVKIFFTCRATRDNLLFRGSADIFNTELRVVEIDLNREVRRCFNCQGYGHAQASCRDTSARCGKCSGPHRTRDCKSDAAAANLTQVICENELDVILVQEPYATNSNSPVISDIPPGYIAYHSLNDSHAYGAAIIVKLELASSCRTTSIPGCNHVAGVDIGSFRFLSAYFRPSNDDISSLFHSAFQNLVSPFTVIAMDSNAKNRLWNSPTTDAKGVELECLIHTEPDSKKMFSALRTLSGKSAAIPLPSEMTIDGTITADPPAMLKGCAGHFFPAESPSLPMHSLLVEHLNDESHLQSAPPPLVTDWELSTAFDSLNRGYSIISLMAHFSQKFKLSLRSSSYKEPPWSLACDCHVVSKEEDLPLCPTDAKTLRLYACHTRGANAFSFCVHTINHAGTKEVHSGILPAWASETQAALYAVNQALQRASSPNLLYHRAEIVSQRSAVSFAFPRAKLTGLQAINLELLTSIKESSTVFACHDSRSSAGLMLAMAYGLLAAGPNDIPPMELAPLLPSKLCAKRETCAVILKLWNREWAQSDTGKITRLFFPDVSSARTLLRRPLSSQLTQILTGHCALRPLASRHSLTAPVSHPHSLSYTQLPLGNCRSGFRRAVAIPATVRYSLEGPTKPGRHIKVRLEAALVARLY